MRHAIAGTLLAFVASATAARGAVTTTVVDIPVEGGTQRILYVTPDAPIAHLVNVPGGDGIFGIQNDGTMNNQTALCGPVSRNLASFAERGIAVALVDRTSNFRVYNYNDHLEVVRYVRARHDAPVWAIGGSASTAAVETLAANLPASIPAGVIFFSPGRPGALASSIRRPAQVVYHSRDGDQFGAGMFAALTAAPVKERVVLSGGVDTFCGFHLFQGLNADFVNATAGFIERNNAATRISTPNFQGLWWKSPAGSESGWGVNLTHQGDILFATWFTYDVDGRGMWLVMPNGAKTPENAYSGALYRTTGPAFSATPFNSAQVAVNPVGTATFSFTDANNGTFAYVVNGVSQSKPITRQEFSTPPECVAGGAAGSTPNYQALWWSSPAGAESGWGVNVAHQGDIVFATWFTYDVDGRGMWLVMPNGARTGPGAYSGALFRTTGPVFSAVPWSGASVVVTQVGTGAFLFTGADQGTFSYTVNGVTQSKAITRQVFASPVTVCR